MTCTQSTTYLLSGTCSPQTSLVVLSFHLHLHIRKKIGINFEEQEAGKGNKPNMSSSYLSVSMVTDEHNKKLNNLSQGLELDPEFMLKNKCKYSYRKKFKEDK